MELTHLYYDLQDELNRERFVRLLTGRNYTFHDDCNLPILDDSNIRYINKESSSVRGAIGINSRYGLYVFTDFEGKIWRDLQELAENFEIE